MNASLNTATPQSTVSSSAVPSNVLYISERSEWGNLGFETVRAALSSVQPVFWSPGTPKPNLADWGGDWIISFKSDLVLAGDILKRAKKGAINFHPSPPKYRGIGGYWWALHNRDEAFGVTCHHMNERIDHGEIIKTESFPIWPGDTTESLKHRAAVHSLMLLNRTLDAIVSGKPLLACGEKWGQHLYTYQELAAAQNVKPALQALEAIHDSIVGIRAGTLRRDGSADHKAILG